MHSIGLNKEVWFQVMHMERKYHRCGPWESVELFLLLTVSVDVLMTN